MEYLVVTLTGSDANATDMLNALAADGWRVVAAGADRDGILTVILARNEQYGWPPKDPAA